jgi:hypothetical protein
MTVLPLTTGGGGVVFTSFVAFVLRSLALHAVKTFDGGLVYWFGRPSERNSTRCGAFDSFAIAAIVAAIVGNIV